jgi:predicted dienelactone hydrolase
LFFFVTSIPNPVKKITLTFSFALAALFSFGQFAIGSRTITYNDPTRTGGTGSGGGPGRQIECAVYYPATSAGTNTPVADGVFPVVVFGHGFAMAWSAYQNIWEHLTPKGYIMVFPKTESGFFPAPSHNDFGLDLAVASNRMLAENTESNSPFYQKVNGRSGIMGHSMGGGATILAAQNNESIKTIIGLAPAETNPSAIDAAANVFVPALILSGSADGVTPPSEHHSPIYEGLISLCKSFVSITGGAHCYYANTDFACDLGEGTSSPNISISRAEQQNFMNSLISPWLDFYLKGDCDGYTQFQNAASSSGLVFTNECDYEPIEINITTTDANDGLNNGSALVLTTGGSFPVDLTWFDGSNNPELTGLAPGTYSFTVTDAYCSLTGEVTILDGTAGLSGNQLLDFQIFPNPSKNSITITFGHKFQGAIQISDASGRILNSVTANQENTMYLDLAGFSAGVYMLTLVDELGYKATKRLIKE